MGKKWIALLLALLLLAPSLAAGDGMNLEAYNGGFFSMKVPEGWTLLTGGKYTSFCFKIFDPNDPSTEVFLYGDLVPFHKSETSRNYWKALNPVAGQAPILETYDIIGILNCWNETIDFMVLNSFSPVYSRLSNANFLGGTFFKSALYNGLAYSESVCSITCDTEFKTGCKMTVAGTLVDFDSTNTYGGNNFFNISNLCGVIAPADRYEEVAGPLLECVASLTFTDAYIQEAKLNLEFMASNADRRTYLNFLAEQMQNCYATYGK